MRSETPTFQDADLVLKLYDLRRETVMRSSRDAMNGQFWPRSYEDLLALTTPSHPMNAAFRQVSTYWEMVYGMAVHGIAHPEYLVDNNAEGLFLFSKVKPYLARFRSEATPLAFRHAEWAATETAAGRQRVQIFEARIQSKLAQG